jgi:hypothetical protein
MGRSQNRIAVTFEDLSCDRGDQEGENPGRVGVAAMRDSRNRKDGRRMALGRDGADNRDMILEPSVSKTIPSGISCRAT